MGGIPCLMSSQNGKYRRGDGTGVEKRKAIAMRRGLRDDLRCRAIEA